MDDFCRTRLKIIDDVDLNYLKKLGFKEVMQDKRVNYIYMPVKEVWNNHGNSIVVCNDSNLFNSDCYIGEDRLIEFNFNTQASYEFNKTIEVLFDLIKSGLVEKVKGE